MSKRSKATPAGKVGASSLLAVLFFAIALLMLGIATASASSAVRARAREQSAPGRVVIRDAGTDSLGQQFYDQVVEFYLPDETLQTFDLGGLTSSPAYAQNQHVTVVYDPERPFSARLASTGSSTLDMWIVPIITGIIGLAFLAATFIVRWVFAAEV